jgi:Flp pilus assembly protein TadD
MGVWSPHTNTGTVHFAEYDELPAKKIWSWGVDADGLDWRKALSDDNSAYLEVQAGLFRNQETYAFLEPRQVIHFSEYWMPVRALGGFSRANLAGVVFLNRKESKLVTGFNANQAIPQASISILNSGQTVTQETADLVPERTWTRTIPNADPQTKYTIEIKDRKGTTLIRQTEGEYDWTPESEVHVGPQPSHTIPDPEKRTYDDWLQFAKDEELNGRNLSALETYKQALAKFPDSFELGKAAGRLSAALLRFEEATAWLEPLHERDTTDTEVSYYLGLAYDGLADARHARTAYEQAERLPTFYAPAALRLGELLAREGDLKGAERHLAGALQAAPDDVRVHEELVAVKAAAGDSDGARNMAQAAQTRFLLSFLLREELGDPDLAHLGNDPDRVLNLASEYMRLGLYRKALNVLSRQYPETVPDQSEPGALPPQRHPMIAYFRGYCREKLGESGADDFSKAAKLSTAYVFPSTAEELVVLRAVLESHPSDATAHYLLGTLYFSRGLTDNALKEWAEAHRLGPEIPVLSASTGLALLHIKNDPEKALSTFRDGLESDPTNIANYLGMDQTLSLLNRPARERVEALEKYPKLDAAPPSLIFELILNLAEAGNFQRANSLFHNRFFPREEGGTNVRQVWIEVQLDHALSAAKSGNCSEAMKIVQNLGSEVPGLAFTRDGLEPFLKSARTDYLLASAYSACGKPAEAKGKLELAAAASAPDQIRWAWLAAQKLPGFDRSQWQSRLQHSFTQFADRSDTSSFSSWWNYTAGLLAKELGNTEEAEVRFRKALLLPDRMLTYHFTRLAKNGATP